MTDNTQNAARVLIIDDDKKLCRLIKEYLEPFGFSVEFQHNGNDGLKAISEKEYDAIILDVMLPCMDGFEVLRQLRRISDVPVLMLTARGDEVDRIAGLEIGADDYLPKTFSVRELLARLRAVLRRTRTSRFKEETTEEEIKIRELRIIPSRRLVMLNDKPLDLTPVEYELLLSLAKAKGRVKTREILLDEIAGRDWIVFDRSIDVHISSLRKKLNDDPQNPKFIRTIRSAGYMMIDPDSDWSSK
jgi:DNA-binding response OmpR family regulator